MHQQCWEVLNSPVVVPHHEKEKTKVKKSKAPKLSAHSLSALMEFMAEQEDRAKKEKQCIQPCATFAKQTNNASCDTETLLERRTTTTPNDTFEVGALTENWQLSQFWYSEQTALALAQEILSLASSSASNNLSSVNKNEKFKIACVSTPTIFRALQFTLQNNDKFFIDCYDIFLFEYDKRFSGFGEQFVFYDFNEPLNIPSHFLHSFDCILLDPPFLSEECMGLALQTLKVLMKENDIQSKVIILTGSVMTDFLLEHGPQGIHKLSWTPQHNKSTLRNDFGCYVNFQTQFLH